MKKDIVIIGGGASGLMAAITCHRQGGKAVILEQKDKAGKKILATGNGKCNFTNLHQAEDCYRSSQPDFPLSALRKFSAEDTVQFFEDLGVLTKEKNGYLYPYSGQASTILEALTLEAKRLGVEIQCGEKVEHITKKNGLFTISCGKQILEANKVILSTGGKASPAQGSDGSGFDLARSLGHKLTPLSPALTGLKAKETYCKALAGVRCDAQVSLFLEDTYVTKDVGELQLTNYGVSGIPVFQICRFAGMALQKKQKVVVKTDFFPARKEKYLREIVLKQKKQHGNNTAEEAFGGLLNKKVLLVLLKQAGITPDQPISKIPEDKLMALCKLMKGLPFHITETNGYENAQVCAGGINTRDVNSDTMESKLVKNLYLAGEILDVDGICGGYNLQWAWSSGYVAGLNAAKQKSSNKQDSMEAINDKDI